MYWGLQTASPVGTEPEALESYLIKCHLWLQVEESSGEQNNSPFSVEAHVTWIRGKRCPFSVRAEGH